MTGGVISPNIQNGSIVSFNILNAGSGYDSNVSVYCHPPSNTGSQCIINTVELDSNGSITNIIINDNGSGYLDDENPLCLVFEKVVESSIHPQKYSIDISAGSSDYFEFVENGLLSIHSNYGDFCEGSCNSSLPPKLKHKDIDTIYYGIKDGDFNKILILNNSNYDKTFTLKTFA